MLNVTGIVKNEVDIRKKKTRVRVEATVEMAYIGNAQVNSSFCLRFCSDVNRSCANFFGQNSILPSSIINPCISNTVFV